MPVLPRKQGQDDVLPLRKKLRADTPFDFAQGSELVELQVCPYSYNQLVISYQSLEII
jgi:hypothetical protein